MNAHTAPSDKAHNKYELTQLSRIKLVGIIAPTYDTAIAVSEIHLFRR